MVPNKWILLTSLVVFMVSSCQLQPNKALSISPELETDVTSTMPKVPFFSPAFAEPVFRNGNQGDWFADAVEPGAIIFAGEKFYMFYNGLDGWPSKAAVGYAISTDGLQWEPQGETPLLDSKNLDFEGFTFFVSSVIQLENGLWAMYLYTLKEGRDGAPGEIIIATAAALAGPWQLESEPVLKAGVKGDWDGSRVTQPHVIRKGGEYWMYYAGYETDRLQGARSIGLAVSQDGLNWQKKSSPVFTFTGEPGDWDARRVFQPRILQLSDQLIMLYKSNISVGRAEGWGLATSPDGLNWMRFDGNPVIVEDTYAVSWRRNGIADMLIHDGQIYLFMEILEREGGAYHHGNAAYESNIYLLVSNELP